MKNYTSTLLGVLVALLLLASSSLYIVDQRQQAILFQLGEVVDVKTAPGLYFKIPLAQRAIIRALEEAAGLKPKALPPGMS